MKTEMEEFYRYEVEPRLDIIGSQLQRVLAIYWLGLYTFNVEGGHSFGPY